LKHAASELSRIVSTKVFTRGNNLIFELDHSNRQLRLMKDSVYDMERKLKEKIRLRFDKDLESTRLELKEQKRKFAEYQQNMVQNVTS